jgi:Caspase domain
MLQWIARLCVVASFFVAGAAEADKRVALVIGNSAYQHSATLDNPSNDAADLAKTLTRLGFEVILEKDLDKRGMEQAFSRFARLAQDADLAMFYYAGHAMQYGGNNYLVPVDAALQDEFSVEFEMARVSDVLNSLERARGVKILVLDACRNNPLADQLARHASNRDAFASRGLARIEHPSGMLIAYATQAGQVAEDGRGRNSPFTTALIKRLAEPGVEIAQIFRRVAFDVNAQTQGRQLPDLSMSLLGEVYLSKPDKPQITTEAEAWQKIASSNDRVDFDHFVADFPDSPFAVVAKERIRILENAHRQEVELAVLQAAREQAAKEAAALQAERARVANETAPKQAEQAAAGKDKVAANPTLPTSSAENARIEAAQQSAGDGAAKPAKPQPIEAAAKDQAAQERLLAERAAEQRAQPPAAPPRAAQERAAKELAAKEQTARLAQERAAQELAAQQQAARDQAALEEAALEKKVREILEKQQAAARAKELVEKGEAEKAASSSVAPKIASPSIDIASPGTASKGDANPGTASSAAANPGQALAVSPPSPVPDAARAARSSLSPSQPAVAALAPEDDHPSRRELSQSIAHQLSRIGCYQGRDSELWEKGPQSGLQRFLRHSRLEVPADQPSQQALDILRLEKGKVCAPNCRRDETIVEGTCVAKTCPAGALLSRSGRCVKVSHERPRERNRQDLAPPATSRNPARIPAETTRLSRPVSAPQKSCPKWCPNDYSPCDPTYFKIADGRCSDPIH